MPDVFNKAKRSDVMSRIRSSGNKDTELRLISLFKQHHITGWRRKQKLFGKPDFVFPKLRLAVFVDGCFWHGCPLHATQPRTNTEFWQKKLSANRIRDRVVTRTLKQSGYRVLRIWEHELQMKEEPWLIRRLQKELI
ncbi:MAG: very short patch repair endonuclease [Verrucomicrobiota bacterium]|nr:very short patch repair endonuclease [Verrucomicrobiota bacterium]